MRKSGICWAALTLLAAGSVSTAHAGPNANAKILLHLLPPTTKNACTRAEAAPTCSEIVTAGALYPQAYFAYLLVTDADSAAGIAGVQCGVSYNEAPNAGVEVYSWTNCATLEFPSTGWPAVGGGNLLTWDSAAKCQRFEPGGSETGVVTVAGYFYCAAYGPDTLRVTPRPVDGLAKVAACASVEDTIAASTGGWQALGYVVFSPDGTAEGYNPCEGSSGSGGGNEEPGPGDGQPPPEWSSGYPATFAEPNLPHQIRISTNKAMLVGGRLLTEGDLLTVDWDSVRRVLLFNGTSSSFGATHQRTATSPEGLLVLSLQDCLRHYRNGSNEERVEHCLESLDTSLLDPSHPPEVGTDAVSLRFRNTERRRVFVAFPNKDTPEQTIDELRRAARRYVAALESCLSRSAPPGGACLVIVRPNSRRQVCGSNARDAIEVLMTAKIAVLTPEMRLRAAELGIDPAEIVAEGD